MPRTTLTDKVDDLSKLVATVSVQLDALTQQVKRIDAQQDKMGESFAEAKTKVALVEQQIADLRSANEEWVRRWWAIVGPIAGAVVGGLLTYLLKK